MVLPEYYLAEKLGQSVPSFAATNAVRCSELLEAEKERLRNSLEGKKTNLRNPHGIQEQKVS